MFSGEALTAGLLAATVVARDSVLLVSVHAANLGA